MLVKRISDVEQEQIVYSIIIRVDNKNSHLVVGRKRHIHLYNLELDTISKAKEESTPPSCIDFVEFNCDIIEIRNYGEELIVILDNLQIYRVYVSSQEFDVQYAGVIKPLADSPVVRIKYTSLVISDNFDYGLLSIFNNAFVVLYVAHANRRLSEIESPSLSRVDSTSSKIQSSYIYYDSHVNSSLLLQSNDQHEENIWHLDDSYNLVYATVNKSNYGSVSVDSSHDNVLLHDPELIDVNYFNKDHIALLCYNSIQFFDTRSMAKTNKVETQGLNLVSVTPLFGGALEQSTKFIGVSSEGVSVCIELSFNNDSCDFQRVTQLSNDQTMITSVTASAINKNKYVLFSGTSYGYSELSTLSKSDNDRKIYSKLKQNHGGISSINMYNNSLVFSYGNKRSNVNFIESSSSKLATKCDLSMLHEEGSSDSAKFNSMKVFNINNSMSQALSKNGITATPDKEVLVLLNSINLTYIIKLNYKQYHLEVIDMLDIGQYHDVYQTINGFAFIQNRGIFYVSYNEIGTDDDTDQDHDMEIDGPVPICHTCHENIVVVYYSNSIIKIFNTASCDSRLLLKEEFEFKIDSDDNVSDLAINSNILFVAFRSTTNKQFSTSSLKVYYLSDKSLIYQYTLPIWGEDVNDKASNSMYITDMKFADDCLTYTYNNTITIKRNAAISTLMDSINLGDQMSFTSEQIFEMHRIIDISDNSIKLGSKGFLKGTYKEVDASQNISIVSYINENVQLKLTPNQELCIYVQDEESTSGIEFCPRYFIGNVTTLSTGCFMVTNYDTFLYQAHTGHSQELFECSDDEEIICTSKINRTDSVFGSNSIFPPDYQYMLAISTKSNERSKASESNVYILGLSLQSLDKSEGDIFKVSIFKRTISYPIVTALSFIQNMREVNAKQNNKNVPHMFLGCGTTLVTATFVPPKINTKKKSEPEKNEDVDMSIEEEKEEPNEHKDQDEEGKIETTKPKDSKAESVKFNFKDMDNIQFEIKSASEHSFTWISQILCYSFKNRYVVVHDLMKGLCLLNNTLNKFTFSHESICLIDSSLILTSHKINNSLFLAQDDGGKLYMVHARVKKVKKKYVWELAKKAEYDINERITSFYSLAKDLDKVRDVVFSTCEGNLYSIKVLTPDMVGFMAKIQFNILKRFEYKQENDSWRAAMKGYTVTSEDNDQLMHAYDKGFDSGFNGDLIARFFTYDTQEIKKVLADIREDTGANNKAVNRDGGSSAVTDANFNLLNLKMLFF